MEGSSEALIAPFSTCRRDAVAGGGSADASVSGDAEARHDGAQRAA
jgi:hypothetical protein